MADLSAEYRVERRSKLVPTLAPRLVVGLFRAGLGLGCAIRGVNLNYSLFCPSQPTSTEYSEAATVNL